MKELEFKQAAVLARIQGMPLQHILDGIAYDVTGRPGGFAYRSSVYCLKPGANLTQDMMLACHSQEVITEYYDNSSYEPGYLPQTIGEMPNASHHYRVPLEETK